MTACFILHFATEGKEPVEVEVDSFAFEWGNNLNLHNLVPQSRTLTITLPVRVDLCTGVCDITIIRSEETATQIKTDIEAHYRGDITYLHWHGEMKIFMDDLEVCEHI